MGREILMTNQLGDAPVRKTEEQMEQSNIEIEIIHPSKYGCEILLERTTMDKVKDKSFPTDARIVR
jgi:hypothetical protein